MFGCLASRWGSGSVASLLVALACSTGEAPPAESAKAGFLPLSCEEDQLREFVCEGLLPMNASLSAPAPYDNCPAGIETQHGAFPTRQRVARFDAAHTGWARERVKPGHTCCYSWCSDVPVREPDQVPEPTSCDRTGELRETYCMPELEAGTSQPADSPFDHCPVALRPPEALHFYVPPAASIDYAATQAARARGGALCCYAWCSRVPVGIFK